ncbi:MAG: cytochrome P450 [Deltaproteobacteria bacterium]|nr:cytochrome P450 [Deltaproteobacteria bacterium]
MADASSYDPNGESDYQVTLDRAGTRAAQHPTRPEIGLLDPEFYVDPEPHFAWMREEAPVYWDDATGIWGITRYDDIMAVSRDARNFCSGKGSRPDSSVPSMINTDPPEHNRRRGIVSAGFTPRRVQAHEPFLRAKVDALIDAVLDRGACDFVRDIATPLPMAMIGELMGLPESDYDQLLRWSDLFATGGDEVREEVGPAVIDYANYIMAIIEGRRGSEAEDLVSLVMKAEFDGEHLTDHDLIFETMLILVGGDETTRHVISGGLEVFMRHRDQWEALRSDRSLLPGAVEEMLRWVTPIQNMNRTATRDVELAGQRIREGDRLLLLYPSGNRDERAFPDAHRFDLRRHPNQHMAFGGYGRHHCLGAQLARLEISVLFDRMLDRIPEIELADPAAPLVRRRGNFVLGLETLPVVFGAR